MSTRPLLAKPSVKVDQTTGRFAARAKRIYTRLEERIRPNYFTTEPKCGDDVACMMNALPDLRVHSVPVRSNPRTRIERFIASYKPAPTRKDSHPALEHFIAANFVYPTPLGRESILSLMYFVADQRFIKPGLECLVSVTFPKRVDREKKRSLERVFNATLYCLPGEYRTYGLQTVVEYTMLAMSEAFSAMEIRRIKSATGRGKESYSMQFRLRKVGFSVELPAPITRLERQQDGRCTIGGIHLPDD